jgi:hypothetical protein
VAPDFRLVTRLEAQPETPVRAGILRSILDQLMARWELAGTAVHLTVGRAPEGLLVHALTSAASSGAMRDDSTPALDHLISVRVVTRAVVSDTQATFVLASVDAPIRLYDSESSRTTNTRVARRMTPATALEGR